MPHQTGNSWKTKTISDVRESLDAKEEEQKRSMTGVGGCRRKSIILVSDSIAQIKHHDQLGKKWYVLSNTAK